MGASRDAISALKGFVSSGGYSPGDRLPPERELIGRLGVTRSTLRKALDALEREGTIWRHVGKGTFVAEQGSGIAARADVGVLSQQLTPVKMMRARLCIEPALAREAAINASADAIARINRARDGAVQAPDWAEYEQQDDQFHHAVAAASDNLLLMSLFDHLNGVQRAVAWNAVVRGTTRPARTHSSFTEHDQIAQAIADRDPGAAFTAMRQHLLSVSARLFGEA